MPSVIAHTNTAISPLPRAAATVDAVGGERDAERVERLLVRRDARGSRAASATAASSPIAIPNAKPSVDVLEHEAPPDEVVVAGQRGG